MGDLDPQATAHVRIVRVELLCLTTGCRLKEEGRRMKHRTLALCLVVGLMAPVSVAPSATAAQQQEGSVFGQILDGDYGDPLLGAEVWVEGTQIRALTAADGSFVLRNVPEGQRQILFRHDCYYPVSVAITIPADSEEDPIFLRFSLPLDHQERQAPGNCYLQWLDPS